jgi:transmembrane sensor
MNPSHPIPDPAAEEQAALWAARLEGSELTAAAQAALDAWLAEDPAHRALLSQYCQLSADLEEQLPALVAAGAVGRPVQPARRRGWNPRGIASAALAAAALVTFAVWLARPAQQSGDMATAAAQRQSVTLRDGTRIELNARTSLHVEIGRTERRVHLDAGEAFFTVSKDRSRPFIVETPAGSVRVTGTVFNVQADTNEELNVTVVEGSVQVLPGPLAGGRTPDPRLLHAGDRLAAGPGGVSVQPLTAGEIEDELAWREGKIVFNGVPLADALERFGRYHGRRLAASPGAAAKKVGGRYSLDDLDGFLKGLEESTLGVRADRDPSGNVRVSLRSEP